MSKFKNLTPDQKKDLLRSEYISDGALESFVDQLIPKDDAMVIARLKTVFGYTDDMEVT